MMVNIKDFLKENYPEDKISEMIDEEVPNWVDRDDSDFEGDDYEWYKEYCNGEAEDVVRANIMQDINDKYPNSYFHSKVINDLIRQHDERLDV